MPIILFFDKRCKPFFLCLWGKRLSFFRKSQQNPAKNGAGSFKSIARKWKNYANIALFRKKSLKQRKKGLTTGRGIVYNNFCATKGAANYAAMAQVVEHVLGKDEVTSSNLVSSSKKDRLAEKPVFLFAVFLCFRVRNIPAFCKRF